MIEVQEQVKSILSHIDPDPDREGLADTPKRVAKMWEELTEGYETDVKEIMTFFERGSYDQMIVLTDIPLYSVCEHHLIPFIGKAHVGYIPDEKVVGLSKIARVVKAYSRRLQVQERLTDQVADAIEDALSPKGVMVVMRAEHLCMTFRGIQTPGVQTTTSAVRGNFRENDKTRDEFLSLIDGRKV